MARKVSKRVLEELKAQKQGQQEPKEQYPPVESTIAPEQDAPHSEPVAHYHIIRGGGTSVWTIAAGVILAVGFLAVLPWLLAGGCLAGLMLSHPNQPPPPEAVPRQATYRPSSRPSVAPSVPIPAPGPGISIIDWTWRKKPDFAIDGTIEYLGKVINTGTAPASFIRANVVLYDYQRNILTTDFTYCHPLTIQPGESATFKGYADYFDQAQTCELSVTYKRR